MALNTRLSDLLTHMHDLQLGLYNDLTEAERAKTGTLEDWSFKDVLAHNVEWANRHQSDLETLERGDAWPNHDHSESELDEINQSIFEQYQHTSWDQIQTMLRDSYARGRAYLDRISEDTLLSPIPDGSERPIWRVFAGNYITHPMIHVWEHLLQNGHADKIEGLFGEPLTARLLALSDDEQWRGTTLYNLACVFALSGVTDRAITTLGEALRLAPGLTEWSTQDKDLDSLRGEPEFQALYD